MSRYIDADAFKEDVKHHLSVLAYAGSHAIKLGTLEQWLDNAPSIDTEPKRGEWIFDDPLRADFECSECLERNDICTPFCPNCGARMKGADDE